MLTRIRRQVRRRWLAQKLRKWTTTNSVLHTFDEVGADIVGDLNASNADILNLHWIAGLLSIRDIARLRKPIVWTLHDMWAFCGGEHYSPDLQDARFRVGYLMNNRAPGERGPDLNRQTWEIKRRAWSHQRFTIVSPSHWLAECANHSLLLSNMPVHVIPNPIDTKSAWQPAPQQRARAALKLPLDRRLILMGAVGGVSDPRKGGDLLRETLSHVAAQAHVGIDLMVYGQEASISDMSWPYPVHWLGEIQDDRLLALACAAADVVIVPSRQDNLPNAAIEAQACGTPVVAFKIGGMPDIVAHKENGWLADPFDTVDMALGIIWILESGDRRTELARQARYSAVTRFAPEVVA
jgi:glycosyltransferase involved in cell wall biosynthesis